MKRIKDPDALRLAHLRASECVLCGKTAPLSIHHVYPKGQQGDDVPANFVVLCVEIPRMATTGCHGKIEAKDRAACEALSLHIMLNRSDTIEYLDGKLGGLDRALFWLERNLYAAR